MKKKIQCSSVIPYKAYNKRRVTPKNLTFICSSTEDIFFSSLPILRRYRKTSQNRVGTIYLNRLRARENKSHRRQYNVDLAKNSYCQSSIVSTDSKTLPSSCRRVTRYSYDLSSFVPVKLRWQIITRRLDQTPKISLNFTTGTKYKLF